MTKPEQHHDSPGAPVYKDKDKKEFFNADAQNFPTQQESLPGESILTKTCGHGDVVFVSFYTVYDLSILNLAGNQIIYT